MSIATLLPLILIVGVMFLMTRSAKNKQRQASQMRDTMQPGVGVRTIGGLYAQVKAVHDDTVEVEIAPGVFTHFAKNAIAAVLDEAEYNRIVNGVEPAAEDADADSEDEVLESADADDAAEAHEAEPETEDAHDADDATEAVAEEKDQESVAK